MSRHINGGLSFSPLKIVNLEREIIKSKNIKNIKVKGKKEKERGIERKKNMKEESSTLSILIYGQDFRHLCLSDKVVHADAVQCTDGWIFFLFFCCIFFFFSFL